MRSWQQRLVWCVLLLCLTLTAAQEATEDIVVAAVQEEVEEEEYERNPACLLLDYRAEFLDENGELTKGSACENISWVKWANVACFYVMFIFIVRSLLLATQ